MRFDRLPFARVALVCSAIVPGLAGAPVFAQAPAQQTIDGQLHTAGLDAFNRGDYDKAAQSFAAIPDQVPTSPFIPEAIFRLGHIAYLQGDYDKAVEHLQKVAALKNVPPEIAELAALFIPQVSSAKASKLPPEDPARKSAFEDAIGQYDEFIQKFPQSVEVESANYGKAVALYQVGRYEDGAAALRMNLQKFANSPSILDSQYLLALTLGTLANVTMQTATAKDASADANYDEAKRLLNDIIAKRSDLALANDARFQIAELDFARAGFTQKQERKEELYQQALDNYRLVASKDLVIQAQKVRIAQIGQAVQNARMARDLNLVQRTQRFMEKERDKLALLENRADQTFTAKLKSAQIFFNLNKPDETRVMLKFLKGFAGDDADAKKQIAYFEALSFAMQNIAARGRNEQLAAKAEESYRAFRSAYNKDKIGENLAIVTGSGFVESDAEKAINYFKESLEDYPDGKFKVEALTQQAAALTKLERFDEALSLYRETLASSSSKEMSAVAEFGIADIHRLTGKIDEAITGFKKVRDNYSDTKQAPNGAFWVGQLTLEKGDAKGAIAELEAFIKSYPDSELMPQAVFTLGNAQASSGQTDAALATYKQVSDQHPKSEVAPYAYFQRASIINTGGKVDEAVAIMREFIEKYPDRGDALFQAYDFVAQVLASQGKASEAIASYEEFVTKNPKNPAAPQALLKAASLQKAGANQLGRYITLNEESKAEWIKGVDASIATAERVLNEYTDSEEVALALKHLLDVQKLRLQAKLITNEDITSYFQSLATKFEAQPATRSKLIFTLASFTFEEDKVKAIEQMASVYDPSQKYAPTDLDLYGQALIEQDKFEEATKVFEKLVADYPNPRNTEPAKAPLAVQNAQSIALFGLGKVLQEQGKISDAKAKFDELEKLYAWSPKMQEANYGIALGLQQQKTYDEALKRLRVIISSKTASPELRADAMLLFAKINEEKGEYESAIDTYIRVARQYTGVPKAAAEGLWKGAQLLEKQANGEIPRATKDSKQAASSKAKSTPVAEKNKTAAK